MLQLVTDCIRVILCLNVFYVRKQHLNERNVLMAKPQKTKKMIKFMLSLAATVVIFFAVSLSASAASYPTIKLDVPRVSQQVGRGDCAIASMATVEAYCHGLPAGNSNSKAYQAVYSANGYSVSAMWSKIGYTPIDGFSMTTAYNQLKTGYPIIVHRSSQHYSVIYGYDGNSANLELSGFLVVDVDDSYNSSTAYFRLDKWRRSGSLDRMVIRQNGLAISTSGVKITTNHPAQASVKGENFTPYGVIVSDSNLTSVKVTVSNAVGAVKLSYSVNPGAKSFNLSSAKSKIDIASLATGNYVYSIIAKNADGDSDSYNFSFTVGQPTQQNVSIKEVSYKAIVRAEPHLNIRQGAGLEYSKIGQIPNGEKIDVTAECNGWAKVTYSGKTGWVSMEYIEKAVEAPDVDNGTSSPSVPDTFASYLARTTDSLPMKEQANVFASTLVNVPKNTVIKVIGETNGWVKFAYNGNVGWIRASACVAGLGDVDANRLVDSADALVILRHATGSKKLEDKEEEVADFDGDGEINSRDALLVLQVSTGSIKYD